MQSATALAEAGSLTEMDNRTERIVLETERHRIVGDLTLPKEGYRSRLSDYLNRGDLAFVPLINASITPIGSIDDPAQEREFLVVSCSQIHLAYPEGEMPAGPQ